MTTLGIIIRLRASILLGVPLVVALGCGSNDPSSAASRRQLLIAVDVSDRTPERLLAYAGAAYRLQRGMHQGDTVRIYEFAHAPELMYAGPPIRGRSQFNRKVASRFAPGGAPMCQMGTRAHLTLERVFADAHRQTSELSVVVLTDGGIEELGPQVVKSLRSSVRAAARYSRLNHLLVGGVTDEWRSRWEDWTAPLGDSATVRGLNDLDSFSPDDLWTRSR